jgi:CMP-N-acetylneuraminic acid synthetase
MYKVMMRLVTGNAELEEIDIDTPLDFEFAKFVYEKHK